jgi:hypothetical protein
MFWGIWSLFGPVPVVREVQWWAPEYTILLPFGFSRWLDMFFAGIWTAFLTIALARTKENNEDNEGLVLVRGGLIFGLIYGMILGLIFGMIFGPIFILIVGLITGLIAGIIYKMVVGLDPGLDFGLIVGLNFALGIWLGIVLGTGIIFGGLIFGTIIVLGIGMSVALGAGLVVGIKKLFPQKFLEWLTAKE